MIDTDDRTAPETMDLWLPYLSPQDCDSAIRLAGTMVEAGLMGEAEAVEWSARLRAWKLAHRTGPEEA